MAAHATGGVVDPRRRIERRAIGREPEGDRRDNLEADDLTALDEATKPVTPYPHWFTTRVVDGKVYEALGMPLEVQPVR